MEKYLIMHIICLLLLTILYAVNFNVMDTFFLKTITLKLKTTRAYCFWFLEENKFILLLYKGLKRTHWKKNYKFYFLIIMYCAHLAHLMHIICNLYKTLFRFPVVASPLFLLDCYNILFNRSLTQAARWLRHLPVLRSLAPNLSRLFNLLIRRRPA